MSSCNKEMFPIIFTSNASNKKVCKKEITVALLSKQLDKVTVTTNEIDAIIANVPKTKNDLRTGYTIVDEEKEYCFQGKHYER